MRWERREWKNWDYTWGYSLFLSLTLISSLRHVATRRATGCAYFLVLTRVLYKAPTISFPCASVLAIWSSYTRIRWLRWSQSLWLSLPSDLGHFPLGHVLGLYYGHMSWSYWGFVILLKSFNQTNLSFLAPKWSKTFGTKRTLFSMFYRATNKRLSLQLRAWKQRLTARMQSKHSFNKINQPICSFLWKTT